MEGVGGRGKEMPTTESSRVRTDHEGLFNHTHVISYTSVLSLFAVAAGSFLLCHSKKEKVS